MTLPIDITFPFRERDIAAGGEELVSYMRDLLKVQRDIYQSQVKNIDGRIESFTPTISGSTTAGSGTYSNQEGLYLRQGILTHVFFELSWTAHTGTGDIRLNLPYQVYNTNLHPFTTVIQSSGINLGAGYTNVSVMCQPNTFYANIMRSGSGVAAAGLGMTATGTLRGNIFYVGIENET